MSFLPRGWLTACLLASFGCFSESNDTGGSGDDDDDTTGNSSDPTLTTTTVDPSVTTTMTTSPTTTTTASDTTIEPTSETDPSVDGTATSDSDTDPSSTTDPTGGCIGEGDVACNDGMAVAGELCFLEPASPAGGVDQIGDIAIGDIDGDGAADVAFTDGGDGYVAFTANGSLQDASPVAGMSSTWSVTVGPLDETDEVAVVFGMAIAEVVVVRFMDSMYSADVGLPAPGEFVTARLGNFNNDNTLDLVVGAEESSLLYFYFNDGEGNFGTYEPLDMGAPAGVSDMRLLYDADFSSPGLALLTRDGRLVVTPPNEAALGEFSVLDMDQTYGEPPLGMLATGDLDDDGDSDIAVAYDGRAFVYRAIDDGYDDPQVLGDVAANTDVAVAIADVDNDGFADVLLADPVGDEIEIYRADGKDFSQAPAIQVPPEPRGLGVADFNADCAADVVMVGPAWLEVAESNP